MSSREAVFLHHQQERWLRPDGARWLRGDISRYLRPGTDIAKAVPAIERKYNADQPRVPAGNSDGGQWTDGSSNGSDGAQPTSSVDFSDLPNFSDLFALFQITPSEIDNSGDVQLAGDIPGIGHNQGPSLDPPEIPETRPSTSAARMDVVRKVTEWIGAVGRYSPLVGALFEAEDQIGWFTNYEAMTKTYHDPPEALDRLQQNALKPSQPGYQDHHIEEQGLLGSLGYARGDIDNPNNIVRIPTLKHYDITAWYATPNVEFGGLSPRQYLKSQPQDVRWQVGLNKLVDFGVLKP